MNERMYLTLASDSTWSASISATPPSDSCAPFVKEQSYPVELYFARTDLNGSRVVERDICQDRAQLLSSMNWCGKCGYSILELWDFDIDKPGYDAAAEMIHQGVIRRFNRIEKELSSNDHTNEAEPNKVIKMIGGKSCDCYEFGETGKMRLELTGTFGEGISRKSLVLVPLELEEPELEEIADKWLTEQEKELGLPEGESCSSSGWWAGSNDASHDDEITNRYDSLISCAALKKVKTHELDLMLQNAKERAPSKPVSQERREPDFPF